MKKFLVDSTVYLAAPHALLSFDDNEVLIPRCVLDDIGTALKKTGEVRANAAEFIRLLDHVLSEAGENTHVTLKNNGGISLVSAHLDPCSIYDYATEHQAVIVSRDPLVRIKAKMMGLKAEPFKEERLEEAPVYTGRCMFYVSPEEMDSFAKEGRLKLSAKKKYAAVVTLNGRTFGASDEYQLTQNEYVLLVNYNNPDGAPLLGRYDGKEIVSLCVNKKSRIYGVNARNVGQLFALDALMNPDIPLVILKGPAGTAKTFLSMAAALEQTVNVNRYRKILLTRPNTKMDNDVGYLKGDEKEKVMPTLRGLIDNLDNLMQSEREMKDGIKLESSVDSLMSAGVIEAQAMAYMRGRSVTRQFMVVDEMQNSTTTQAISIVTRVGDDSKIVLLGDPNQIDAPFLDTRNNGLVFAADRMKGSPLCAQITFNESECIRSPLAKEAISRLTQKGQLNFSLWENSGK